MADKPIEKPDTDMTMELVIFLVGLVFLIMIYRRIKQLLAYYGFGSDGSGGSGGSVWVDIKMFVATAIWPKTLIVLGIICVIAIAGIIYALTNYFRITKEEKIALQSKAEENDTDSVKNKNEKWHRVIDHINSPNSTEWRLAIIEADVMLDELLESSGFMGVSIGEKLKAIDEENGFLTVNSAWEAHKIRNRIAHDGADFELTEREAKRVIALYESVFQEFKLI